MTVHIKQTHEYSTALSIQKGGDLCVLKKRGERDTRNGEAATYIALNAKYIEFRLQSGSTGGEDRLMTRGEHPPHTGAGSTSRL